jgi:hypothetical protein
MILALQHLDSFSMAPQQLASGFAGVLSDTEAMVSPQ